MLHNDHSQISGDPLRERSGASCAIEQVRIAELAPATRRTLDAIDTVLIYHTPLITRFRGVTEREGLLLHGPEGWSEAAPFWDYGPPESSRWLMAALEAATQTPPTARRTSVPVNVTIPVGTPAEAAERVHASGGCTTAKVKVADPGMTVDQDCERVAAVARELARISDDPHVRIDANMAWDVPTAIAAITALHEAAASAGGLEYAEQPCRTVEELARVRARVDVPIAADESIRRAEDPYAVIRAHAADVAIIKLAPLGGARAAREIAERAGIKVVVSSALESSIGLAHGLQLAACLPVETACGLATAQLFAADTVREPLKVESGRIQVHDMRVDEKLIDACPLPAGCRDRWIDRLDAMCAVLNEERQ